MYDKYENSYYASEIAAFLDRDLVGDDCVVYEPASVNSITSHRLIFIDNVWCRDFDFNRLAGFSDILVITDRDYSRDAAHCAFIVTPSPRVDFIRVLNRFFVKKLPVSIHPSAQIDSAAALGENISVGANAYIGPDVRIGENTVIHQNVVVDGRVTIGKNCIIKANSTIGSEGFSFIIDDDEYLQHFPQIGEIIIGDDVWVGANTTIERAALDHTCIEDGVKIDDLVQIGHNSRIGRLSQVTAGVVICGRVNVGEKCWIAPKSCIDNGVVVGDEAFVGMGAVVLQDVNPKEVVAGVPAKFIRKRT